MYNTTHRSVPYAHIVWRHKGATRYWVYGVFVCDKPAPERWIYWRTENHLKERCSIWVAQKNKEDICSVFEFTRSSRSLLARWMKRRISWNQQLCWISVSLSLFLPLSLSINSNHLLLYCIQDIFLTLFIHLESIVCVGGSCVAVIAHPLPLICLQASIFVLSKSHIWLLSTFILRLAFKYGREESITPYGTRKKEEEWISHPYLCYLLHVNVWNLSCFFACRPPQAKNKQTFH